MTRLTVTLEERTVEEIGHLPFARLARDVREVADLLAGEESPRLFYALAESCAALGREPSASAVMRTALDYYLTTLREMRKMAQLEEGYAALAADAERQEMVGALPKLVPQHWADEE